MLCCLFLYFCHFSFLPLIALFLLVSPISQSPEPKRGVLCVCWCVLLTRKGRGGSVIPGLGWQREEWGLACFTGLSCGVFWGGNERVFMIIRNERVFVTALVMPPEHWWCCYYCYPTLWRNYFGKVEPNVEKLVGFWHVEMEKRLCCGRGNKLNEGTERRNARHVLETLSVTFSWSGKNLSNGELKARRCCG